MPLFIVNRRLSSSDSASQHAMVKETLSMNLHHTFIFNQFTLSCILLEFRDTFAQDQFVVIAAGVEELSY
jgi:hypothetical protein